MAGKVKIIFMAYFTVVYQISENMTVMVTYPYLLFLHSYLLTPPYQKALILSLYPLQAVKSTGGHVSVLHGKLAIDVMTCLLLWLLVNMAKDLRLENEFS
jgi:predicted ABC-type exoprotein transport system permease subunit